MSDRTCPACSGEVTGPRNKTYCSDACRYRVRDASATRKAYEASPERQASSASRNRARYRDAVSEGKESGARLTFWREHGVRGLSEISDCCVVPDCDRPKFARLKCKPHYQREMLMAGNSWAAADLISGADHERRAKKYGVPFERFDKLDIYERDGWICGICLDHVDANLIYPDPMSASLDHVIPLSRGGGHLESNAQCSHLSCNVRKGVRDGEEAGVRTGRA